jgi:hypothetical protein
MRPIAALLLFACPFVVAAQEADKRLPPPDAAAIEKASKSIQEVFGQDILKAKTFAARKDLAVRSLTAAYDPKEPPANRWVLYAQARELAGAAGDVPFTIHTINDLAKAFQIKRGEIVADVAEKLAKSILSSASKSLVEFALEESDAAVDADDYKSAVKLLTVAHRVTQQGKDGAVTRRLEARLQQVKEFAKAFDEHMGKFQCFRKGNWEKGLPLLMKSQDENLAVVVKKDIGKPGELKEQVEVGDAWFELGEKAKGEDRLAMMRRAFYWFISGVSGTSGLVKAKTESRISKIIAEVEEADIKDGRFTLLASRWRVNWNNNFTWEMTITVFGRVDMNRDVAPDGTTNPSVQGYEYLVRKHNGVTAKKGEGIALHKNGDVIDVYRISVAGVTIDRYNPGSMFPKKVDLSGKVTPIR